MRKKIVAGNWKMNENLQEGVALAKEINDAMKIAAAKAIASFVTDEKLCPEYIIPSALEKGVAEAVAAAVAQAAKDTGVARI